MNWSFLIASYLGLMCVGLIDNGRGALYEEILHSLNISTTTGSQMFALAAVASLLIMLFSKWWLTRFNLLRAHAIFLLTQAVSCIGMGYSETVSYPVHTLLGFSFIYGLSMGGTAITTNLLVAKASTKKDQRRTYAGLHSMYGVASLLSPLLISGLLAIGFKWGQCLQLFAILPFGVGIYSLTQPGLVIKPIPKKESTFSLGSKILLGLIFACYVSAELALSSRLVFYLSSFKKMDGDQARNYLSLFFALLLIGRLSFSAFKLPLSNRSWLIISLSGSLVFSLLGLYIHPIGLSICGLSMSFFFPCGMSWVNELSKKESDTLIRWVMTLIGFMLIVMHWLIGQLATLFSIQVALIIIPLFILFALILLLVSHKKVLPMYPK